MNWFLLVVAALSLNVLCHHFGFFGKQTLRFVCRRPPEGVREQHLEGKEAGLASAGWGEVNEVRVATESSANRTGVLRLGPPLRTVWT